MGIRGLSQLATNLKTRCGTELTSIHTERNRKWAVDASLFLHRSRTTAAYHHNESEFGRRHRRPFRFRNILCDVPFEDSHIVGLVDVICQLLSAGITPIIVFDGAPPPEKLATVHKRRMEKIRMQRKIEWVEKYIIAKETVPRRFYQPKYTRMGNVREYIVRAQSLACSTTSSVKSGISYAEALVHGSSRERSLATTLTARATAATAAAAAALASASAANEEEEEVDMSNCWYTDEHEYLPPSPEEIDEIRLNLTQQKRHAAAAHVGAEHVYQAQSLCEILCIPYIQAVGEADVTVVALQRRGLVHAVYTADTDCVAYGATRVVRKIINYDLIDSVDLPFLLRELSLTYPQFVRFCVLAGCDFCEGVNLTTYKLLQMVRHPSNQGNQIFESYRSTQGDAWVEKAIRAFEIYTHAADEQEQNVHVTSSDLSMQECCLNYTREYISEQLMRYFGMRGNYIVRIADQIVRSYREFESRR
jgi:5'-3' exonuclease